MLRNQKLDMDMTDPIIKRLFFAELLRINYTLLLNFLNTYSCDKLLGFQN